MHGCPTAGHIGAMNKGVLKPMTDDQPKMRVVPIPSGDSEAEHRRIRSSNDRDQKAEREGKESPHNQGYDEAADGKTPPPHLDRVVDE